MGDIAVRVAGLGKEYHIGSRSEQHDRVTDALLETVATPFRRIRNVVRGQAATSQHESFWALKDLNFEVKHGEVVGIIGRNGAGKSTLLKILSRITEPTTGYAEVYGRVGALLEVGTGFHPELTGRENIFLNGAILGMSRLEIEHKFDEIVDFAGIEKFIDTPVKHYSSGMGLRLGFAVAAHLEPEILIVDEVLAVGDAEFQKKCLGKMNEVAGEGRTVLFVSHNMAAVQNLCNTAIFLKNGSIASSGPTQEIIQKYLGEKTANATQSIDQRTDREGSGNVRFTNLMVNGFDSTEIAFSQTGSELNVVMDYEIVQDAGNLIFYVSIFDLFGIEILHMNSLMLDLPIDPYQKQGQITCSIHRLPLPQGHYRIDIAIDQDKKRADWIVNATGMTVEIGDFYRTGQTHYFTIGKALVDHRWFLKPSIHISS